MASPPATLSASPVIELRQVKKTYPGVIALAGVDLTLHSGEVHMLLGENGAGKSTLVKILAGAVSADPGSELLLLGQSLIGGASRYDPRRARSLGISVIHQELNLIPTLSAAQNMALAREPRKRLGQLDHQTMRIQARNALAWLGTELDVDVAVEKLSVAKQQLVEIAAALLDQCKVLILDEPTSALAQSEVQKLGETLLRLKDSGVAILYVTHRFEEVFAFGDRATVFRDGQRIAESLLNETDKAQLIRWMVGRDVADNFPRRQQQLGEPVLEVKDLCSANGTSNVSFSLRRGEVLALAGLMGSGRTEVARALFGADPATSGTVSVQGRPLRLGSVRRAVKAGLALVPEDRKHEGLVLGLGVGRNVTLTALGRVRGRFFQIARKAEEKAISALSNKLRVKAYASSQLVGTLSGGNQQKVVLAKWLHSEARVLMFDEPTRGIDVGAKQEIYRLFNELVAEGAAVLMISSELPEVLGMADRILVMCQGRIAGELARHEATPERVLDLATRFEANIEATTQTPAAGV